MIYGIFGVNGAGKTLTMTKEITKYDIVFVNYNYKGTGKQLVIVEPDTQKLFYELIALVKHITVKRILQEHIKIALAIDEAGITFPAREWKKMSSEEAYLFAQHRKLGGMDFLYTAQNAFMIDRTLRVNTAVSVYPTHFFNIFFVRWYWSYRPAKQNLLYITTYIQTKSITSLYNTYEEVSSSKFYFSNPNEHIDVIKYLQTISESIKNIKDKKLGKLLKQDKEVIDNVLLDNNSNNSSTGNDSNIVETKKAKTQKQVDCSNTGT